PPCRRARRRCLQRQPARPGRAGVDLGRGRGRHRPRRGQAADPVRHRRGGAPARRPRLAGCPVRPPTWRFAARSASPARRGMTTAVGGGPRALLVAAPASGSGKTTVTLALLRALARAGRRVASAKAGPDYIDPRFHAAASGVECVNLDPWAMRPGLIRALFGDLARGREVVLVEAMMGLFDGAADGSGSAADLAAMLGLPVVLVVDVAAQAQSVAALVHGFARF